MARRVFGLILALVVLNSARECDGAWVNGGYVSVSGGDQYFSPAGSRLVLRRIVCIIMILPILMVKVGVSESTFTMVTLLLLLLL